MQNFNSYQGYTYVMDPAGAHNLSHYPPVTNLSSITGHMAVSQSRNNVAAVPQPTLLINPHFGKKVFINPNFQASGFNQALPQTLDGQNLGNSNESILSRHNVHVNPASLPKTTETLKVHVNPANIFKTSQRSNIHVNPAKTSQRLNVHVNPNCLLKTSVTQRVNVHVNPNVLKLHNAEAHGNVKPNKDSCRITLANNQKTVYQSATKIIRQHKDQKMSENVKDVARKRRPSVRSKYKIVKSSAQEKRVNDLTRKTKTLIKSKYKLVKARSPSQFMKSQVVIIKKPKNLFKLDNRRPQENRLSHHKFKQFVYVNKFLSTTELARILPLKQKRDLSLINISGILYRKSHNSLQRSCPVKKNKKIALNVQRKSILKSKYNLIRKSLVIKSPIRVSPRSSKKKVTKVWDIKPKVDPTGNGKLRICNIPCPYYRKFGRCKGKDNGKCYRKHDPGQIALCTKFLQGACVNEKCLLSHNVSPEKMPTCKFYLEGICSKENCPYLHVKISPKADICRDFLEGFCKMATKCTKRHQLLCPDFEKHGSCQKQRCPYPHGRMVRKYSVFNKNKFAKKSSDNEKPKNIVLETAQTCSKFDVAKNADSNLNTRYYEKSTEIMPKDEASLVHSERTDFRSRPKLGALPSFIGFEES